MKKFLTTAAIFAATTMAFAEGTTEVWSNGHYMAHLSLAIAAGLCGLAQGKAVVAACEGMARNPQAAGNIRTTMIIGLALIEALVIYVLVAGFAIH